MNRNDAEAGNANVKDHRLAEPKEARFVKFSMELPTGENAVRIYGFDIYGKLKERTDRGNLVSVGKTFLKSSGAKSFYTNARHIFDGLNENTEYHWDFDRSAADKHYCILDLEDEYDVNAFKVYDANQIEGYNIYVATETPDLDKINNSADENSVWTLVSSGDLNKTNKSVTVDRVKARYVKIEIPSGNIDGESATVTEFEVYMDGTSTGLTGTEREVTLLYPNPVKRGESLNVAAQGRLKIYTIDGVNVCDVVVDGEASVSTQNFIPGIYLAVVSGSAGDKSFKLIVE